MEAKDGDGQRQQRRKAPGIEDVDHFRDEADWKEKCDGWVVEVLGLKPNEERRAAPTLCSA